METVTKVTNGIQEAAKEPIEAVVSKKVFPVKKKSLLAEAMVKCQSLINPAGKSGENKFDHYKYSTLEDYCNQLKPALTASELAVYFNQDEITDKGIRETSTGKKEYVIRVKLTATIMHSSGECMDVVGYGEGQDRGDKAIYKAITGCKKYLLANAFNIPTTDDPEVDSHDAEEKLPPKGQRFKDEQAVVSRALVDQEKKAAESPQKAQDAGKPVPGSQLPAKKKEPSDEDQAKDGLIITAQVKALQKKRTQFKIPDAKWKAWLFAKYAILTAWKIKQEWFAAIDGTVTLNPAEIIEFVTADDVAQ
jgi:hypothetical protein